ncbi:hypothetical protein FJW04_24075 [Mesorhizobium sp. B2-7-3]|uniref:hypothetical protein n=1 Tax=Mesorhizobium sp. B2-7-3 TaxID=2589907 RepID=UPI00112E38B4|nr:hypothetical protein [Mesorhizobium sp. B2-7-3]TPJ11438.1 hypothetical protein FJW04_24075 [Mesorhizobium sp. B2-7-3]
MKPTTEFDQVDVTLAEDRKTVILHAYAGEALYLQTVHQATEELDTHSVEVKDADLWRARAVPSAWWKP